MFTNLAKFFNQDRSYAVGVLEDNVERSSGFSKAVIDERRKATRIQISVPVWYKLANGWAKWLLGKSVDQSATGIRLTLPAGVKPGTEIDMRMKLPGTERAVDVKGVVVWVEPKTGELSTVDCGIAFKDIRKIKNKESLIYLIANQICKIGLKISRHLDAGLVTNEEDLKKCYSIVYQGYAPRKYCNENPSGMHYYYYSFLPESRIFYLKEKGNLLGTISLVPDSPCGLPMDSLFQREIDHLRGNGKKIAEVVLLAMAPEANKHKTFSLTDLDKQIRLFRLFKIMCNYVYYFGITDLVIGVHPKHETLYRYLDFKAMGEPKSYAGARGNPALPMHLDMVWAKDYWSMKTFFFSEPASDDVMKGGLKLNTEIVRKFLFEYQDLWTNIPHKSQEYLKKCYPGLIAHQVNPFVSLFKK